MKTNSVVITAIICLSVLEVFAMHYGINGTFRTIVFTAIAGLAGWRIPMKEEPIIKPQNTVEVKV